MNQSIKQELAFSCMMVVLMVAIMLSYNAVLVYGLTVEALNMVLIQYLPTVLVAFAIEQLVVSHNVHKLHGILVSPSSPQIKHVLILALLFVTFMAALMSLYGTLLSTGTENNFWSHYLLNFARNWPVALLAQLIVAGPIVREVHASMLYSSRLT